MPLPSGIYMLNESAKPTVQTAKSWLPAQDLTQPLHAVSASRWLKKSRRRLCASLPSLGRCSMIWRRMIWRWVMLSSLSMERPYLMWRWALRCVGAKKTRAWCSCSATLTVLHAILSRSCVIERMPRLRKRVDPAQAVLCSTLDMH